MTSSYAAVVLAGGASRRMGGVDKTRLVVGGRSLLDRTLAALDGADTVVVVGPPRPVTRRVSWTSEQPPGGGPVAALRAGLTEVRNDVVLLLAADLPLLDAAAVDVLVAAAADGGDGAVYVDDRGREQWLCSAWHSAALRRRLGDGVADSMHRLLAPLQFARLPAPASIADCDTPDDVRRTEEMLT